MKPTQPIHVHSVPLADFCDLFPRRWTPEAIRKKIQRGQWAYGREFVKDPDGQIHILMAGYWAWVNSADPLASKNARAA